MAMLQRFIVKTYVCYQSYFWTTKHFILVRFLFTEIIKSIDLCLSFRHFYVSDVKHFLFYLLCEVDADGFHLVGYFSKVLTLFIKKACHFVLIPNTRNFDTSFSFSGKTFARVLQLSLYIGLSAVPKKRLRKVSDISLYAFYTICFLFLTIPIF